MAYQRTDYTTSEGKKSAAYYEPLTMDAWDVFHRMPVALVKNPVTGLFSEGASFTPATPDKPSKAPSKAVQPVNIKYAIHPLMIIPAGLFGLAMIWMALTFIK